MLCLGLRGREREVEPPRLGQPSRGREVSVALGAFRQWPVAEVDQKRQQLRPERWIEAQELLERGSNEEEGRAMVGVLVPRIGRHDDRWAKVREHVA